MRITTNIMRRQALLLVLVAFLSLAVVAPVAAQALQSIAIGPYVQNVGTDNATICWATKSGEASYAPADLAKQTAVRGYQHHELTLRYLQPGTTYTYDVLGDGSDAGKGSFTTFPAGEHPFRFVVVGDTHAPAPTHQQVIDRVMVEQPDLLFHTGDLVSDGLSMYHWETFFRVNHELMRTVPYYPALGNHELDSPFYFESFALPGNEHYYSFNRGAVHFVVLDSFGPRLRDLYWGPGELTTNQPVTPHQLETHEQRKQQYWQEQLAWLKDDLQARQDAKYVFVFFHHPLYSAIARRQQGAQEMRERFGTIFQDYRVSAVFTGHNHHYHRAVAGGVQFVTNAGGGGGLYDIDAPQPETVKSARVHHFVRIDVGSAAARARVIDVDGRTVDEFELAPRPREHVQPTGATHGS